MGDNTPATSYDAFLSADRADVAWAEGWLLPRLAAAGLRIATASDFAVGVSKLVNIEHLTDVSRHTLCVLSPAWLASEWRQFEALLTQSADPAGLTQRMLPLLRVPCTMPRRIALLEAADFTGPADQWERELRRVIRALGGAAAVVPSPAAPASPLISQAEIQRQQERLRAERDRLGDLLIQLAKQGLAWAPPALVGGIREARASIAQVKATLRGWGVDVPDYPDDTERPTM